MNTGRIRIYIALSVCIQNGFFAVLVGFWCPCSPADADANYIANKQLMGHCINIAIISLCTSLDE
jgi:hypothetical protein